MVVETFNWDEEEVSDDKEVTQVNVLMALPDDELTVEKNHARNGEWIDITMKKVNTLLSMDEDADWQNYLKYINIDLKFVEEQRLNLLSKYNKILNHALQEQLKEEKKINEKRLTSSKKVNQCISEQIPHQKKKVLGGEFFTESSSKMNENENLFIPASMGYDQEMVLKSKDWCLKPIEASNDPESSKDSESESLTPLPPLKNLQGASLSSEPETQDSLNKSISGSVTVSETELTTPSVPTKVKNTEQESKINELTILVQMLINEKVNSAKKTRESKLLIQQTKSSKSVNSSKTSQDSKPKVQNSGSSKSLRPKPIQKPQLKCELYYYTNHSTDDYYMILYCMICKREDHRTSDHEMYIVSLKKSENYKAQPYQYASPSKQILKAKAKPFPPCTHYGFNDHRPDDCRNYPECEICRSYDHFTS
ncbi:hypothetical protein Tco_0317139 [Tanacetum coccineum]